MKKLGKIYNVFFSTELPTELVLFNIITVMGFAGGVLSVPFNMLSGMPVIQEAAIVAAVLIDAGCIYAANFRNQLRNSTIIICFAVAIVLFPIMYFTGGGIHSGMVCWFSLGMIYIFMLLDGMDFFFMLLTDVAVIFGCLIVSYYHPDYVISLSTDLSIYIDVIQSLLITTVAIGVIIKFQVNIYSKLYSMAEINNDELLEKTLAAKKSERLAQSATEAKSNFLANMSHEIRTPINTIMGMDEMILRETSEKKVEEYAIDIMSASKTLLSLINDILDITKIEAGKMEIIEGEYSFIELMHDVINGANIRIKEKGLELNIDVDENVPCEMFGDDVRIKQILTNIITNAVKYTHEGHIDVSVRCNSNLDNTVDLTFSVKDTGIGIKPEDIKRLFESFERLEVSRNRNIEGAGLGMAITQNLLKMMDSNLKVESEYGVGSNFSFTITQGIVSVEPVGDFEQRMAHMTSNYEYTTSFEAPNAHFLVVDDNAMNRKVFVALLKEARVKITEAASGYECLELMQKEHFDMIFLDHMMPGMDGLETFKEMESLENNMCKGTPVIALTANAVAGAKERYLTLGFHGFLSKPVVPAQLEKMIRDFIPEDLMEYHEENENEEIRHNRVYKVELPEIEGVDWEYALLHFPDTNMVFQTAMDFYNSIDYEKEELLSYYNAFETDRPIEDYRIKVHAIKSMANTIGATALGGLAKTLEYAARDGLDDRIMVLTPILIEELDAMKERLGILQENVDKPAMEDMDEFNALLEMLKMALLTHNSEQADNIMRQITSYSYPPEIQSDVDELNMHILNLEDEEAMEHINSLQA